MTVEIIQETEKMQNCGKRFWEFSKRKKIKRKFTGSGYLGKAKYETVIFYYCLNCQDCFEIGKLNY